MALRAPLEHKAGAQALGSPRGPDGSLARPGRLKPRCHGQASRAPHWPAGALSEIGLAEAGSRCHLGFVSKPWALWAPPPGPGAPLGPDSAWLLQPAPRSAAGPVPGRVQRVWGRGWVSGPEPGGWGGRHRGRDQTGNAGSWPGVATEPGAGLTVEGASGCLRGEGVRTLLGSRYSFHWKNSPVLNVG